MAAARVASSAASSRDGSWWNGTRCLAPTTPREVERVVHRAVSPPDVARVFLTRVLRVVQEEIDRLRQLEARRPVAVERKAACAERGLVIGQIGQRALVSLQPIAYRRTRMADPRRPDAERADGEALAVHVVQLESAGKVAQQHREERGREIAS